jgi:protein-L-isoaspartate(D-aspartate) O-methyltransferase
MNTVSLNTAREQMIYHQIRPWDVSNPRILNTLSSIARERFVPENYRQLAFADTEIPLPCNQSMLKPIVEGRLLQALAANSGDRALVIGTGSGFLTACVATLSNHVTSLDIHAELTDTAAAILTEEKIRNVELLTADFNTFSPSVTFDRIIISGSMPLFDTRLPEWLSDAGRLLLFTGSAPNMKAELVVRSGETYTRTCLYETVVPVLENIPQPETFKL